ncbi:unnamed protein product [Periconia digitata]|uniref:Uncharacterized protein n=1 Tax=Periconia digitata TaxID=1303443 RepID=A0A9W4UBC7_9PLEO|nr:unnamed protein product [Periconia digitata]
MSTWLSGSFEAGYSISPVRGSIKRTLETLPRVLAYFPSTSSICNQDRPIMKLFAPVAALLALGLSGTNASTIPLTKRTIYGPGGIMTPGQNISAITAWTYAAFAHATNTISNSTTELTYLCKNFDDLSSRYYTAFTQPNGDVAKLAKEAICSASKAKNPSPLPVAKNQLWYVKYYTAGVLNAQAYAAKTPTPNWFFDMCYYIEATLLRGLWAPCLDTDEGGVDVESGFCASAGYYSKGPFSTYTSATQPADIARQADVLMSKVMGAVFKLLAKDTSQIDYVCNNWAKYEAGIGKTGLVASTLKEQVCGQKKVVEVKQAKADLASQMTDLFIFQLLKAGNTDGYYAYMCSTYSAEAFNKFGLNGAKVVDAFCKAAA